MILFSFRCTINISFQPHKKPLPPSKSYQRQRAHCWSHYFCRTFLCCYLSNQTGGASTSTCTYCLRAVLTQTAGSVQGVNRIQARKPRPSVLHLLHLSTLPVGCSLEHRRAQHVKPVTMIQSTPPRFHIIRAFV